MRVEITIASGCTVYGTTCWMAYMQGKRGRLSPRFGRYDALCNWLYANGYLAQ